MAKHRLLSGVGIAGALALVAACTVHKTEAPPLTGPSELGTAITVQVTPDVLTQDGASQSLVTITARNANGQPIANLPLRADILVNGVIADFGTLSAHNVVTDSSGRAQLTFTAPPAPAINVDTGTIVSIGVTPSGTDFANANARTVNIRLVPPGVVTPPSTGVTAKFTFTPATPADHQPVLFDASTSTATNATILSYQWTFGDGGTATGITAQHSFDTSGTYVVTLRVTDSIGRSNTSSQTVTVTAVTINAPVIAPPSPAAPKVGQPVFFTTTTTTASNGRPIRSYLWSFGDGTTATGQSVSHTYTAAGTYTVLLTIEDDQGHTASSTTTVTVAAGP
jgi:PKD repeat protein